MGVSAELEEMSNLGEGGAEFCQNTTQASCRESAVPRSLPPRLLLLTGTGVRDSRKAPCSGRPQAPPALGRRAMNGLPASKTGLASAHPPLRCKWGPGPRSGLGRSTAPSAGLCQRQVTRGASCGGEEEVTGKSLPW